MRATSILVCVAASLLAGVHADDTGCNLSEEVPWPVSDGYTCQPFDEAYAEVYAYLFSNMPAFDAPNAPTLFVDGAASAGINISLAARQNTQTYPWAKLSTKEMFLEYVAPYANVNEARTHWRGLLPSALQPVLDQLAPGGMSVADAYAAVNGYLNASMSLWTVLTPQPIVFKSNQTPLVYDPMSTLAFAYASCTGISILLVDALRSIGIAARLVGTPAWNGEAANGNHNWVEVWQPGSSGPGASWSPIEGKPAGGGEALDDPCTLWFCNPAHFPPLSSNTTTPVYAARFSQDSDVRYPMAWDLNNTEIPGVYLSTSYAEMCGAC